jgi:hypothetical protein
MTGEEDDEFEIAHVNEHSIRVVRGDVTRMIMQFGRINGDVSFGDGIVIAPGDEG